MIEKRGFLLPYIRAPTFKWDTYCGYLATGYSTKKLHFGSKKLIKGVLILRHDEVRIEAFKITASVKKV